MATFISNFNGSFIAKAGGNLFRAQDLCNLQNHLPSVIFGRKLIVKKVILRLRCFGCTVPFHLRLFIVKIDNAGALAATEMATTYSTGSTLDAMTASEAIFYDKGTLLGKSNGVDFTANSSLDLTKEMKAVALAHELPEEDQRADLHLVGIGMYGVSPDVIAYYGDFEVEYDEISPSKRSVLNLNA